MTHSRAIISGKGEKFHAIAETFAIFPVMKLRVGKLLPLSTYWEISLKNLRQFFFLDSSKNDNFNDKQRSTNVL